MSIPTHDNPDNPGKINDSETAHDEFYETFPKDVRHHIKDLHTSAPYKPQVLVWSPSLTYVIYINRVLKNLFATSFFTSPILHPINFLLLITVYPILVVLIVSLEAALHIGFKFGLGNLIKKYSDQWGHGLSIVNWWDPRIFGDEVDKIVKDGIEQLNAPLPPPSPEDKLDDSIFGKGITRDFHLDAAELSLFMSCIIYERDDELVREAHSFMNKITERSKGSIMEQDIVAVKTMMYNSEKRIHEQAKKWGLEFTSLSELSSIGGPFSGMFWSLEHDFIVVVFKGTTPSNFEDFVVDLMFQRTDARGFLFGEVHEGFYTSLFPGSGVSARSGRASPYITMIRAIRAKASEIKDLRKDQPEKKINVWITGHSLGAALATLFYARLIKSPKDLGPNCILRNGYTFGCPSVGNADFAAEFCSFSDIPYDNQSTLWRVIDDIDVITKLPPFWDDPSVRSAIDKYNMFNYSHVGEEIKFFQDGRKPSSTRDVFYSGKEPVIVNSETKSVPWHRALHKLWKPRDDYERELMKKNSNSFEPYKFPEGSPLPFIENLLPVFFRNHLPARYFAAMEKGRNYFDGLTSNKVF